MINLADNTNAWGMAPVSRTAYLDADASSRYPTPYADELKAAISAYTGCPVAMITTGCGSDDVLDCAIRALAEPGDGLALTEPTFPMIELFARLNRLVPIATSQHDLGRTDARIVYVCSPNNPTGELIPRDYIIALLGALRPGQVLIVDEAYAEFAGASVIDLVSEHTSLLVTRTMSKAFGLAGVRVGYALGHAGLIAAVEKSRGPYKVAALSERAAVAALTDGVDWMTAHAALAVDARQSLIRELRDRGLAPVDSMANFVYLPMPGAIAIGGRMREAGIAVRSFANPSALRITVGPPDMMDAALAALDDARRSCA